jgi:hypothetical protein
MATSGGKPRASIKIGAKKVPPSTPDAIAIVAIRVAMGSIYQYSRFITGLIESFIY